MVALAVFFQSKKIIAKNSTFSLKSFKKTDQLQRVICFFSRRFSQEKDSTIVMAFSILRKNFHIKKPR